MAMSDARVREIFTEMAGNMQADIEQRVGSILVNSITEANDLKTTLGNIAQQVVVQVADSENRVSQNVTELNQVKEDLERVFVSCKEKFAEVDSNRAFLEEYAQQFTTTMNETSTKNNADTAAKFETLTAELNTFAATIESRLGAEFESTKKFITEIEDRIRKTGIAGGADTGGHAGKKSKLTTKDCPVMKMQDKINVLEFRQWMVTVELQLESAHDMVGVDRLFEKLRFIRDPITRDTYTAIIAALDDDFECPINAGPAWEFDATTRFMYSYMIGKLNANMFEHVQNFQDHNGWEVVRLVMERADKPPENAAFKMGLVMNKVVMDKEGKQIVCKSLKETVSYIKVFDDAIVQFQRNAGEKPDMKYLKMLLWQVCDVDTKLVLMQKGFDSPDKDYWMMCKEIKTRNDFYHPGQLVLAKSGSADVEMGISSFEMPDAGLMAAGPPIEPIAPT